MSVVEAVELSDGSGWVLRRVGTDKLESAWVFDEQEAKEQVETVNENAMLAQYRPRADDPDVQRLISDPDWEAVTYEDVEVLDEENSELVYVTDASGARQVNLDGSFVVNWQASKVATKVERHPKRVEGLGRIGAAIEHVARARMEADR